MDNQPQRSGIQTWIRLLISILIIVVAVWVFMNRQFVADTVTTWRYQPSAEIVALADRSGMNERGRFLFYASEPILSDHETFVSQCQAHSEQTAILGCYSGMRIYLFDIDDERLDGVKEVTAAHEMLHAAYDRLTDNERQHVNQAVEAGYQSVKDDRLDDLLAMYEDTEPGQRSNELFAILGTEYRALPDELENIYDKYFEDRSTVVALAEQYQSTFEELAGQQAELVAELNTLVEAITSESERYNQLVSQLSRDVQEFNRQAEAGQFESQAEFDRQRSELVARQSQLVALREAIDSRIARYDRLSSQLEEVNLLANELNQSINPNLAEAPQL